MFICMEKEREKMPQEKQRERRKESECSKWKRSEGEGSRERQGHREGRGLTLGAGARCARWDYARARPLSALHSDQLGEDAGQWGMTVFRITLAKEALGSRCYEPSQALSIFHVHWIGLLVFMNEKHSCILKTEEMLRRMFLYCQ